MKLDRIDLLNFRQFFGEQTLECSTEDEKNVTLIHAENGVGKTTILNSILWAFYGTTTARFEHPDQIVNFEHLADGHASAAVGVRFDFEGAYYEIRRTLDQARQQERLGAFKVIDGEYKPLQAAETFVQSVLPAEMARYFFFDGEHAEAFAAANNSDAVGRAIRNMLGSDMAETALDDLHAVTLALGREIGKSSTDVEMEKIEGEIEALEDRIEGARGRVKELEQNIGSFREQNEKILKRLREMEGAKEIQASRDSKVGELKRVGAELTEHQSAVIKWIGTKSINVIAKKLADESLAFIDEASLRGKIPSPYNEDFVKGLLEAEVCVCERHLKPGSSEFAAVMALLDSASNADTLKRVSQARARIGQIKENRDDAIAQLEHHQEKLKGLFDLRAILEQQIVELGKKLEKQPIDEIGEREAARRSIQQKIDGFQRELGGLHRDISEWERKAEALSQQRDSIARKNERSRKIMLRRDLSKHLEAKLQAVLLAYENDARSTIETLINNVLRKTTRRDYKFGFREDFSMDLLNASGKSVPRSGGENQLVSLAFTSALIEFARLRQNAQDEILTPGTISPLILDSPFGQLDKRYRAATVSFVPEMASQVILLVSSSQGDPEVLEALEAYVGMEYVLISENREQRGEKPRDQAVIGCKEYDLSLYGQDRTLTRIERVR